MATNTRKLTASAHSAVDEIAAGNPELLEALVTILGGLMATETAVVVPAGKKGAKKTVSVDLDDEDDDDDNGTEADEDEDADDEGEADEDDDDDADLAAIKPKGKGKTVAKPAAKAAAPAKGGKSKIADLKASTKKRAPEPVEEEEDEDEGDGEAPVDVAELTAEGISDAFQGIEDDLGKHDRVIGGIKELTAFIDDIGYDVAGVLKMYDASTTAEKKAALTTFASNIEFTIDAIMAYELDDVVALVAELTEEEGYKPAGRSKADKELNAARDAFKAVTAAE